MRVILAAVLALTLSGCAKKQPLTTVGGKSVSHWVEATHGSDAKVRKQAVIKLGNFGPSDPAVYPALVQALGDTDARVRREAILSLVKLAPHSKDAIPSLIEVQKKDGDASVRDYATRALDRLQH